MLDFSQPVAPIPAAVLHFLPDDTNPAAVMATLLDALPSGSYLVAFSGLELVPPGVVLVSEWRSDCADTPVPLLSEVNCYGGVARKS